MSVLALISRLLTTILLLPFTPSAVTALTLPILDKPVILAVPGAWVTAPTFEPFIDCLRARGYAAQAFTLPSINSASPAHDTVASDAAYLHSLLCLLVDLELDVAVLMHSYGGIPGNAAINRVTRAGEPIAKVAREKLGLKGGVVGLVMVASFAVKEGATVVDFLPSGKWLPWFRGENHNLQISISNPKDIFFNDLSNAVAARYITQLGLTSASTFVSPSGPPAWVDEANFGGGRRVFVKTAEDHALVPQAQDAIINSTGVTWDIKVIQGSGHMPFVSHTEELVGIVDETVRGFKRLR